MQMNLTPDWSVLVIMLIFIANYFVVRKFFLQPVNAILVARDSEIRDAQQRLDASLSDFDEAARAMETRLHQAKKEGSQVRERFRGEAMSQRGAVLEKTRAAADQLVGAADLEIKSEVDVARKRIVADSEALARLAAEKIVGRKLA